MSKKIKKRRKIKEDVNLYIKEKPEMVNQHHKEIALTLTDKITYLYKRNESKQVIEVTNVSYEIKVRNDWLTIVRYDSSHGYLHRHVLISTNNQSDTPTTIGVKKKGDHTSWLTWAIEDIKTKYVEYKRGFLKRSKIKSIDNL